MTTALTINLILSAVVFATVISLIGYAIRSARPVAIASVTHTRQARAQHVARARAAYALDNA